MENNQLHKSGENSILYNVSMKVLPLSSHIFIWTYPVCFAVMIFPFANSIYLSISVNKPGIKSEISGVVLQATLDSKIQLVGCELSPNLF